MGEKPRMFGASAAESGPKTMTFALVAVGVCAAGAVAYWALRPPPAPEHPIVEAGPVSAPTTRTPKDVPVPGVMKKVPAGTLHMGGPGGDPDELPAHDVEVAAFEIDETEVTVRAYAKCVDAKACTAPDKNGACNWGHDDRSDNPINCVDYEQATAYCKFVSLRLPHEAEWEYAAHGGEAQRFPWKDGEPGKQACWNGDGNDEGRGKRAGTCAVGSYPSGASPFGVLDMAGNVFEWTDTPYCPYDKPDCGDAQRVIRGGAWNNLVPGYLRAQDRSKESPATRNGNLGFRCAK